jgi:hypothetical protein
MSASSEPTTWLAFLDAVARMKVEADEKPPAPPPSAAAHQAALHAARAQVNDPALLEAALTQIGRGDTTYFLYLARRARKVYKDLAASAAAADPATMTTERALLFDLKLFKTEEDVLLVNDHGSNLLLGATVDSRAKLAKLLWESPKTQSRLAVLLDSTPSRWLLEQEIPYIEQRRTLLKRHVPFGPQLQPTPFTTDQDSRVFAFNNHFAGIGFSGGGIRSATFNLGVLQALAELHLLKGFDYASSVSGGGYIHQWYAAWLQRSTAMALKHAGPDVAKQQEALRQADSFVDNALIAQPKRGNTSVSPPEIAFLRSFSNYLTPKTGAFSLDTWTLIVTWMRNAFLNQVLIAAWIVFAIALVRLVMAAMVKIPSCALPTVEWYAWRACLLLFIIGWLGICLQVWALNDTPDVAEMAPKPLPRFLLSCTILDAFLWMLLSSAALWTFLLLQKDYRDPLLGAIGNGGFHGVYSDALLFTLAIIGLQAASRTNKLYLRATQRGKFRGFIRTCGLAVAAAVLGAICSATLHAGRDYLAGHREEKRPAVTPPTEATKAGASQVSIETATGKTEVTVSPAVDKKEPSAWRKTIDEAHKYLKTRRERSYVAFFLIVGPSAILIVFFLCVVLHHGLEGRYFRTLKREWLARMRAAVTLRLAAWTGITMLAVFGPLAAHLVWYLSPTWMPALWAAISGAGVLAGNSGKTSGTPAENKGPLGLSLSALAIGGGYVFIVGYLIALSALVEKLVWWMPFGHDGLLAFAIVAGAALALGLLYGVNLDINQFSMHAFYRNRLARCYLGASTERRTPEAFTGIDPNDSVLRVADLLPGAKYPGPFPIFCATVNISVGEDLAWQERKGASFAFTPLMCGYDIPWQGQDKRPNDSRWGSPMGYSGFRNTHDLGAIGGPFLATAAAVSGAAASPNMGFHTNLAAAFLLTCFNVRLGWWQRNTRLRNISFKANEPQPIIAPTPNFPAKYLLLELLGKSSAKSPFLNLTDGGHFDNMGLYELVRRRCRCIVLSDAAADADSNFDTIAGAIERCRSDFGVEITLDLNSMLNPDAKDGAPPFKQSFVVGEVRYPEHAEPGVVVYMKASIALTDPAAAGMQIGDVQSYTRMHKDFPNDSTADQWFDEGKFESYRLLGRYIALATMKSPLTENARTMLGGA